ncbi:MAG: two-component system response regulator, partial [Oscillospiraceae bacterium]|nr:two-component system response regulator [Oscillospiraceae bacterium]
NGGGYPFGLAGEDIPLEGRIMAIADVYDALVSERPYKQPFAHEKAVEIIKGDSGTHFDPKIVEAFLNVAEDFWVQSQVAYQPSKVNQTIA